MSTAAPFEGGSGSADRDAALGGAALGAAPLAGLGHDRLLTAAYGAAHFGKSLFWHFGGLLLAFFLTEVAGMDPAAMGVLLAASLGASALADVAVGRLWRRALSRPRAAADLQAWGAAVAAGAVMLLFCTPLMAGTLRAGLAVLAVLGFRLGYSLFDTPQNALLGLATADAAARARMAALRVGVSALAALSLAAAIMPLVAATAQGAALGATDARVRLFIGLGAAMAVIAVATALALRLAMARRGQADAPEAAPPPLERSLGRSPGGGLAPLLALGFAFLFAMTAFAKLEPYFVAYVLRSPVWAGVLATVGSLGVMLSQPLWARVLVGVGRRRAFLGLSLALLGAALAFGLVARHPWAATACVGVLGVVGGGLNTLLWSALSDHAAAGSRAGVGLTFGLFTATAKAAAAAGGLSFGLLLSRIDYRDGDGEALIRLMAGFPVAGALGCVLIVATWAALSGGAAAGDRAPASA